MHSSNNLERYYNVTVSSIIHQDRQLLGFLFICLSGMLVGVSLCSVYRHLANP